MNLDDAKSNFKQILSSLEVSEHNQLFNWIKDEYTDKLGSNGNDDNEQMQDQTRLSYGESKEAKKLDKIAKYLKKMYPFGTKLSKNEQILNEVNGFNASLDLNKTIELDGFIYDEDDIDDLVDKGLVSRFYCENCNSSSCVKPFNFITHSVSREILHELFRYCLNFDLLKGKQILDIGSRIGAWLYGCYVYSADTKIIGVEMNKELCDIQEKIVGKFKFGDRIQIVNDNILNCPQIVQSSDFIFMHNVFEFFLPNDQQLLIWKFLKKNIKKGAILITIPSVDEMTRNLVQDGFSIDWLYNLNLNTDDKKDDDQPKMYLYEVV